MKYKQTNYKRGADKERRIVNRFREAGYLAFRSAGSHSPIDVFALNPKTHEIILVQSKLGKFLSNPAREKIIQEGKKLNGIYTLSFALME